MKPKAGFEPATTRSVGDATDFYAAHRRDVSMRLLGWVKVFFDDRQMIRS